MGDILCRRGMLRTDPKTGKPHAAEFSGARQSCPKKKLCMSLIFCDTLAFYPTTCLRGPTVRGQPWNNHHTAGGTVKAECKGSVRHGAVGCVRAGMICAVQGDCVALAPRKGSLATQKKIIIVRRRRDLEKRRIYIVPCVQRKVGVRQAGQFRHHPCLTLLIYTTPPVRSPSLPWCLTRLGGSHLSCVSA